jgi:hypothetical protein
MKYLILFVAFVFVTGCSNSDKYDAKLSQLQSKIDSMRKKMDTLNVLVLGLQPDLGEIMIGVQMHHAKLWFAGKNDNWKLAEFEANELKEQFEAASHLSATRPEVASLPMIYPAVDSITNSIKSKDHKGFCGGFEYLTSTCNKCHQMNKFEFNVVQIPSGLPVVNQIFTCP